MIKKSLAILKTLFFFEYKIKSNSGKNAKVTVNEDSKFSDENGSFHYWWNFSY